MKNLEVYEKVCGDLKRTGDGWFMANCPYPDHEDRKASFKINEAGYFSCFGCNARGDSYVFAKDFGYDPTPYARGRTKGGNKSPSTPILPPKTGKMDNNSKVRVSRVYLDKTHPKNGNNDTLPIDPANWIESDLHDDIRRYQLELKEQLEKYSNFWEAADWNISEAAVERHQLGYSKRKHSVVIPITESTGHPVQMKIHKYDQWGTDKTNKWYPADLIAKYDKDKNLLICAGEKDAIHILDHTGWQVATVTGGELSMPEKKSLYWNLIDGFKRYVIIYDNDKTGREGSQKMSKVIKERNPASDVRVAIWPYEDHAKGWDCTLSIQRDGGVSFTAAIDNAKQVNIEKIGGFDLILPSTITKESVKTVEWFVDTIRPKGFASIIGGETGSNKSHLVMQEAMCIATGLSFLDNTVKKPAKVLYVDTEIGKDELMRRYLAKIETGVFNEHLLIKNFSMVSKRGNFDDVYADISKALHILKPKVCYIDNMYTSTDIVDLSKNYNLKHLLQRILRLMDRYDVTIVLVCHFNKPDGNVENAFNIHKIAGGSYLANWSEHIQIICNTNQDNLRLFRTVKSRGTEFSKAVYGLEWGGVDKQLLSMDGLYSNWKHLLIDEQKFDTMMHCLEDVADGDSPFDANRWCNVCMKIMDVGDRQARRYLKQLVTMKMVNKIGKDGNAALYRRTNLIHKNWQA